MWNLIMIIHTWRGVSHANVPAPVRLPIATIAFFNCHLATIMDVVHVDEATGQKTPVQSRKRKRKASQTVELEEEHQVTGKERLESEAAVKKVRQHVDGH